MSNIILFYLQVHFEDSQFENNRSDGKRFLKWNAVPTLFDVPNKPHKVTITRINPLERKRSFCKDQEAECHITETDTKRMRHSDHSYAEGSIDEAGSVIASAGFTDHSYCISSMTQNAESGQLL